MASWNHHYIDADHNLALRTLPLHQHLCAPVIYSLPTFPASPEHTEHASSSVVAFYEGDDSHYPYLPLSQSTDSQYGWESDEDERMPVLYHYDDEEATEETLEYDSDDSINAIAQPYHCSLIDPDRVREQLDEEDELDNILSPELEEMLASLIDDYSIERNRLQTATPTPPENAIETIDEMIARLEAFLAEDDTNDSNGSTETTTDNEDIRSDLWGILEDFEQITGDIASIVEEIKDVQEANNHLAAVPPSAPVLTFDRDRVKVYVIERPDGSLTGVCQSAEEVESVLRFLAAHEHRSYNCSENDVDAKRENALIYLMSSAPLDRRQLPPEDGLYFHFEYQGALIARMQSWEVRSEAKRGWRYQSTIEREVRSRGVYTVRPVDLSLVSSAYSF